MFAKKCKLECNLFNRLHDSIQKASQNLFIVIFEIRMFIKNQRLIF